MRLVELATSKYRLKKSILEVLDLPPKELSKIYDDIYGELLQDREGNESRLVQATLSWLLHARMPITGKHLMQAIRSYANPELEEEEATENLILDPLSSFFTLPTVDSASVLDFAHLSVREHFEKHKDYMPGFDCRPDTFSSKLHSTAHDLVRSFGVDIRIQSGF